MLRVSTLIHMYVYSLWDFLFIFLLLFVHLIVLSRRRRLMFSLEKKNFFNMNEKQHILKSEHQTLGYFP